jgi:hypothetical protein
MLLEFDADQRLWQETVRDAVAKQCPPSLVRSIAENGVDPSPLWKTYIDAGWTELTDRVASCQDAREGGFVASRDCARLGTRALVVAPDLLVVILRSWAVRAWI